MARVWKRTAPGMYESDDIVICDLTKMPNGWQGAMGKAWQGGYR